MFVWHTSPLSLIVAFICLLLVLFFHSPDAEEIGRVLKSMEKEYVSAKDQWDSLRASASYDHNTTIGQHRTTQTQEKPPAAVVYPNSPLISSNKRTNMPPSRKWSLKHLFSHVGEI